MAKVKRTRPANRRRERDAFVVKLTDRLRDLIDPRAIMAVTCEQLGEHLAANRVVFGEIEDDVRLAVRQDYSRGVRSIAGTYRLEDVRPSLLAEGAGASRVLVTTDVTTDPRLTRERAHYKAIQMRSAIAVPLVKGGRLKALLGVHQREPREWSSDEVALVREIAERTWAAVERATAEAALRASEERLRLALEASGMGTFLWDAGTDHVEANARLLELCDIPADAPSITAALRARIHPEDGARYDESWSLALNPSGPGSFRNEFRVVHTNGEVRWIVFTGKIYFEGVPPRAIRSVGTAEDITERKRAEAVLTAAARRDAFRVALADALRCVAAPSELRRAACRVLNQHLGASRTFYAEIDPSGTHSIVEDDETNGVPSVTGRHPIEDFGDHVLRLLREGRAVIVNNINTDAHLDQESRAFYAGHLAPAFVAVPLIKEGRLAACLVVNQSSPRAWTAEEMSLVEETADRTWATLERARAVQELREADRRKDEFLAILAHELRNPLAPLRNALEVMKLTPNNSKAVEQARDMMTRQLVQMIRLIDDLLDVSRISRGKVVLRRERIELERVLKQAVETNSPLIEAASHHLRTEMPAEPIFVEADSTRLAQVFANLLNNAAKYTDPGGEILLSAERQGDWAVIRVRDTGIGIPKEMLPLVFDMFLQVDRSLEKARGGLGVGLSLVKGLVELHGGSVEAHSEGLARGSEFVVRLPTVPAFTVRPAPRVRKEPAAVAARRRILVVDDNRDSAISMATVLTALNYETKVAFDGVEAIKAAAVFQPAIVLLDIGMPRLNGYDTCRRIRKQPWGRNILIVALTGWGREQDQRRTKAAGFDSHLVKPVDPSKLSRLLASLPAASTAKSSGPMRRRARRDDRDAARGH